MLAVLPCMNVRVETVVSLSLNSAEKDPRYCEHNRREHAHDFDYENKMSRACRLPKKSPQPLVLPPGYGSMVVTTGNRSR